MIREYKLGRIVDHVYHNLTHTKKSFVPPEEVAAVLNTTPQIVEQCRKCGQAALKTLTRCNNRLIFSIIKNLQMRGLGLSEMLRVGQLGLQEAIERHDVESGNRLSSIAKHYIRGAVLTGLAEASGLTDYAFRLMSKYRQAVHQLKATSGGQQPSKYEIAEELKWTLNQVEKVEKESKKHFNANLGWTVNLEANAYKDPDSSVKLKDIVTSKFVPEGKYEQDIERANEFQLLQKYLTPQEFQVMKLKYGLGENAQWHNALIANELDLTVEEVRAIIERSKEKLKVYPESVSIFHRVISRGEIDFTRGDGAFDVYGSGIFPLDALQDVHMHREHDLNMTRDKLVADSRPDSYGFGADEPDFEVPRTQQQMQFTFGESGITDSVGVGGSGMPSQKQREEMRAVRGWTKEDLSDEEEIDGHELWDPFS